MWSCGSLLENACPISLPSTPTLPLRQGLDEILPPHAAFLTLPAHQAPSELTDAAHGGLSRHDLRCESAGSLRLTRPVM